MIYSMYSCAEDSLYHPVVIKDIQRFWKRILIVDDDVDVTQNSNQELLFCRRHQSPQQYVQVGGILHQLGS
jgi:hypothetical protein